MDAGAWAIAWVGGAAAPATHANPYRALVQLPRRNRPGAQNRDDNRRQQCGFDLLAHRRVPFRYSNRFRLVSMGLAGPGSLTHALVVPPKSWQIHPPRQGLVALQVPVQAGNSLDFVCSCRAETLPAHRTAVIKIASDAFFTVFMFMVISFLIGKVEPSAPYFNTVAPGMGCDAQNMLFVSIATTQMQPVGQGLVKLQLPQMESLVASVRSCARKPSRRTEQP